MLDIVKRQQLNVTSDNIQDNLDLFLRKLQYWQTKIFNKNVLIKQRVETKFNIF